MQQDQTVAQMAQEALMRQAKALAQRRGYSLEDARQAVVDTEAGRQLSPDYSRSRASLMNKGRVILSDRSQCAGC
jgi:hypothetical protein